MGWAVPAVALTCVQLRAVDFVFSVSTFLMLVGHSDSEDLPETELFHPSLKAICGNQLEIGELAKTDCFISVGYLYNSPEARASNLEICLPGLPYRQFWYPQVENTLGQLFSVGASQSRIAKQVKCDIKL